MAILERKILDIEGGYCNDEHDAGGETNFGISKRSYPHIDIKALTPDQAMEIYRRDFWDKNQLSEIDNQALANVIFYMIVNMGSKPAVKLVQDAINLYGFKIEVDGFIGDATLSALHKIDRIAIQDSIRVKACKFYLGLCDHKPEQVKFFRGWIRRALM
jgi:lysozyme family protein